MASLDSSSSYQTKWTAFISKVELVHTDSLPFWRRYLDIIAANDSRTMPAEAVQLLDDMVAVRKITPEIAAFAKAGPLRNFARFAFPFCNLSRTLMTETLRLADDFLAKVDSSTQSGFGKAQLKAFIQELRDYPLVPYLPSVLTPEMLFIIANTQRTFCLSFGTTSSSVDTKEDPVLVHRGDMGIALAMASNVLCHVFASRKCPGGGVWSKGVGMAGQEEVVHQKNPLLLPVVVCLFGIPLWEGEDTGKFRWSGECIKCFEADGVLLCQLSVERNAWVAYMPAPDYRNHEIMPSADEQYAIAKHMTSTLTCNAAALKLVPVLGEAGTGIYKGSVEPVIRALYETKGAVICSYVKEWATLYPDLVTYSSFSDAFREL